MSTTKAKIRANARYQKKAYDQLAIRVPKGERDLFTEYANESGVSLAEYVRRACYHASGKGTLTESVAYAGWVVRTHDDWVVAERIDNGEEGWMVAPLDANHMAELAAIEEEWSPRAPERTESALDAIKSWNPIRHTARSGFTSYQDEDGCIYFEDDMYRYKTTELVDSYLVGCDDDGSFYYFRDGLGADPVDLLDLVIGDPEAL